MTVEDGQDHDFLACDSVVDAVWECPRQGHAQIGLDDPIPERTLRNGLQHAVECLE